jgi:hypothetical protein
MNANGSECMSEVSLETVYALLLEHQKTNMDNFGEIKRILGEVNGRTRTNETAIAKKADVTDCQGNTLEIARLKTWVALIGGGMGLVSIVASILQLFG